MYSDGSLTTCPVSPGFPCWLPLYHPWPKTVLYVLGLMMVFVPRGRWLTSLAQSRYPLPWTLRWEWPSLNSAVAPPAFPDTHHWTGVSAESLGPIWLSQSTDWSPPGFSARGISQARILGWVAAFFSRGYPWPGDHTHVFCVSWISGAGRQILHHHAAWEAHQIQALIRMEGEFVTLPWILISPPGLSSPTLMLSFPSVLSSHSHPYPQWVPCLSLPLL